MGKSGLDGVVCPELLTRIDSERRMCGAGVVRETRTVSISMTVLKPFSDSLEIGARKFPAAPARRTLAFS